MIFSKNPHKRAKSLFNLIAPFYGALDSYVKKGYKRAINNIKEEIDLKGKSVLDIGSGPGAWAALFKENGAAKVHGVDFAKKMVNNASKRYSPAITFSIGDAENLNDFEDNSFDIVTASFLLHGVTKDIRQNMLKEMKRISRKDIIINDYYGKTHFIAKFLEWLEKSDYKHFKLNFCKELKNNFSDVKKITASLGTSVYFASTNGVNK